MVSPSWSFKVFDYGVVSVALRREFSGDWADLVRLVADLMSDDALGRAAERACTEFIRRSRTGAHTAADGDVI